MMELINEILKYPDCPHCGSEWEYQCGECEKEEMRENELDLKAFKDGVADACLRGIRDEEQTRYYYKQGYDFGMALYSDMIEETIV